MDLNIPLVDPSDDDNSNNVVSDNNSESTNNADSNSNNNNNINNNNNNNTTTSREDSKATSYLEKKMKTWKRSIGSVLVELSEKIESYMLSYWHSIRYHYISRMMSKQQQIFLQLPMAGTKNNKVKTELSLIFHFIYLFMDLQEHMLKCTKMCCQCTWIFDYLIEKLVENVRIEKLRYTMESGRHTITVHSAFLVVCLGSLLVCRDYCPLLLCCFFITIIITIQGFAGFPSSLTSSIMLACIFHSGESSS